MGAERADEDAGFELEKVDVVVLTCGDDESTWFDCFLLNDLNCIDGCSMGNDEILFQKEVFCLLSVEIYFWNVP